MRVLLGICLLMAASVSSAQDPCSDVMSYSELAALTQPPAGVRLAYGDEELQFGELFLPSGEGLFPVVIVIHGGCWRAQYDVEHVRPFAAALAAQGYAIWTPEYRRAGNPGGGWPGTFLDVANAVDFLRAVAEDHRLDLGRVVVMGHSAGGHLALWIAARKQLEGQSELRTPGDPLPVRGVVSLAGIPDLAAASEEEICGDGVPNLLGGDPKELPERASQGSPSTFIPLGVSQWILNGRCDPIVPPQTAEVYAADARSSGDNISLELVDGIGHFELIAPESKAWPVVLQALEALTTESGGSH